MKSIPALACSALFAFAAPAFGQDQTPPPQTPSPQTPLPPVVAGAGASARAPASQELMAARRTMRSACAADIVSFCGDTATAPAAAGEPGRRGGARLQCLRGRVTQVSPPCRQAMAAMRDARKAAR